MTAHCVILGAGTASRMGGGKLLLPFGDGTVLDAVLAACAAYPTTLVASAELAGRYRGTRGGLSIVVNGEPQRGMAHSLRLAHRAISAEYPLAILLGDKPLVSAALVGRTIGALQPEVDVVYPARNGVPGHPVVLSARARGIVDELRDGDTLHLLRDDPRLRRRTLPSDDDGAFVDIDTEVDYRLILTL